MCKIINILMQLFGNPLAAIFVLSVSCNLLGVMDIIPTVAILTISSFVTLFILYKGVNVNTPVLVFMLYLPVEILLSQPDPRFHSWERMGLFVVMMASISPLLQSEYARKFRVYALQFFIFIIVIASIGSFFAYFLGVNMMVRNNSNEYIGIAGHFGGLFNHSMKLGPMASLATLFLTYKGFIFRKKWLFLLAALCSCAVLFSASRGSFVGLIIGMCFLIYRYSENRVHLIKIMTVTFVVLFVTYPIWNWAMAGLEQKQAGNVELGGTLYSRSMKWYCRIREFASSPIWGIGFSSIDPDTQEYWNKKTGVIEPGTSWLAILSMTGLSGFILFMRIYWKAYMLVKKTIKDRSIILYTFLIFFSIHMITEGYIFAAGNPVCIIFWLLLACCYDMRYDDGECDDKSVILI